MQIRRFKPGERVRRRGDNKVMIVQKYCLKRGFLHGSYVSDHEVACVWYDGGVRRTGIFDQRTLTGVERFDHSYLPLTTLAHHRKI